MSKEFLLINHLDKPMRFIIFTQNEVLCICGGFCFGILFDLFFTMLFATIVGIFLYRKYLGHIDVGKIREQLYVSLGFDEKKLKYKLPSHMKRMIG